MKKHFVCMVLVCAMVCFGAGMSLAGQGKGAGDGTGPIHDILGGDAFEFTGDVTGFAQDGSLILSTAGADEQLYGIGPAYYWESLGVAYPVIGDTLTAHGFTVDYNGVYKNVVMSIRIYNETINLRDPATGKTLWRGSNGSGGSVGTASYGGTNGSGVCK